MGEGVGEGVSELTLAALGEQKASFPGPCFQIMSCHQGVVIMLFKLVLVFNLTILRSDEQIFKKK